MTDPFDGVLAQDQSEDHALDQTPSQRDIASDLSNLAAPGLSFVLLKVLQLRDRSRQQLENDRSIDERQDSQGEHPECGDAAAGENIQEAQQ